VTGSRLLRLSEWAGRGGVLTTRQDLQDVVVGLEERIDELDRRLAQLERSSAME
jgi:hypothetical protein